MFSKWYICFTLSLIRCLRHQSLNFDSLKPCEMHLIQSILRMLRFANWAPFCILYELRHNNMIHFSWKHGSEKRKSEFIPWKQVPNTQKIQTFMDFINLCAILLWRRPISPPFRYTIKFKRWTRLWEYKIKCHPNNYDGYWTRNTHRRYNHGC